MADARAGRAGGAASALVAAFAQIPTINGHTHVIPEADRLKRDLDALSYFAHPYCAADLQSAGMDDETLRFVTGDQGTLDAPAIRQPLAPLAERWARFEPWWHRIRHTGFSQCLVEGWRAAYGISGLDASTVGQISDAIRAGRRPGHYAEVLKGMANIRISLMQMGGPFGEPIDDVDADLFVPVPRLNRLTMLRSRDDLTDLEREYGEEVDSVEALAARMAERCATWKAKGLPEVKLSQSYHRAMDFGEPDHAAARTIFEGLRAVDTTGLTVRPGRSWRTSWSSTRYGRRPPRGCRCSFMLARAPGHTARSKARRLRRWRGWSEHTVTHASTSHTAASRTSPKLQCWPKPARTSS